MNPVIFSDNLTKDNYQEFVEQVVNIFRISNLDKYILFSLRFEESTCIMKLSVLRNDGNKQEYEEVKVDSNEPYFYEFLEYLVKQIREHCEITREDIVNLDDDNYVAFRMITNYNDLITMDGLTETQAKKLMNKEGEKPEVKLSVKNSTGGSNLIGFLFMIIALIVSIITVIAFVQ